MRTVVSSGQEGILDYVSCSGEELSLWQCRAKHAGPSQSFRCSSTVRVVCAGKRLLLFNTQRNLRLKQGIS